MLLMLRKLFRELIRELFRELFRALFRALFREHGNRNDAIIRHKKPHNRLGCPEFRPVIPIAEIRCQLKTARKSPQK